MAQETMIQFFHWYYPSDKNLWQELKSKTEELTQLGFTSVWLPPAYKGADGIDSVGYDTYDLFDLGEFNQKGTVRTKYGTRDELVAAVNTLEQHGLKAIFDVVLNHKMGADETERVRVRRANKDDRTIIEDEEIEATAHTRYTFPGRAGKYSQFIWDMRCFTGVDKIEDPDETGVFRLVNEYGEGEWNEEVDDELGNFDYLMGADVEFRNRAVYKEILDWGVWLAQQVRLGGFRLDAVKHIPAWFLRDWVGHMRNSVDQDLLMVAEYWHPDFSVLNTYLDLTHRQLKLFDIALHNRFYDASHAGPDFDLREIFSDTLLINDPDATVAFVENHDTQPLQALETTVSAWFKPHAYALLLMNEKGIPCVFYADLFGASYADENDKGEMHEIDMPVIEELPRILEARKRFAKGPQSFLTGETKNCVCLVRHGTEHEPGSVTVLTNGEECTYNVDLGPSQAKTSFRDFLGKRKEIVTTDDQGKADFPVNEKSVSIWVPHGSL